MPDIQNWFNKLQLAGYRITSPMRTIVAILVASNHGLNPLDVFNLGRLQCPGLGLVTVYRTLEKLEELGLVQRIHQPGCCNMYLRATQGHEHILVCNQCGRVEYFQGDELEALFQEIASNTRYEIKDRSCPSELTSSVTFLPKGA